MIFHRSIYEEDEGWTPCSRAMPDERENVQVCHIHFSDWNLEFLIWESEGRFRMFDGKPVWTVKGRIDGQDTVDKDTFFMKGVTHWRRKS